jgi:hypothetical protein
MLVPSNFWGCVVLYLTVLCVSMHGCATVQACVCVGRRVRTAMSEIVLRKPALVSSLHTGLQHCQHQIA